MELPVAQETCEILGKAIGHLLVKITPQGHWGDVRSTALACWALNSLVGQGQSPTTSLHRGLSQTIRDCRTWLIGQARREEGGVSWESEAWDTALAVLALASDDTSSERLDQATAWLRRIADVNTGAWYDEVWETTLSTAAILRREASIKGPRAEDTRWLERVFAWIGGIPSKPSGEFVCPHYSGFLSWLAYEFEQSGLSPVLSDVPTLKSFQEKARLAQQYLVSVLSANARSLWSCYTFSNSYVVYALSSTTSLSRAHCRDIVAWYKRHQGQHGGFEDIEDTALAVLALGALAQRNKLPLDMMLAHVPSESGAVCKTKPQCFLGYGGDSKGLALELKEFLARMLPELVVRDWRWDFVPGHHLFAEIDAASRECRVAIFLVTKEDWAESDRGPVKATPRDNVVFEIGFFAARIGIENTILVVEEGTTIPTDLGGVLYINLRDRRDISCATTPLLAAIRRVLSECPMA